MGLEGPPGSSGRPGSSVSFIIFNFMYIKWFYQYRLKYVNWVCMVNKFTGGGKKNWLSLKIWLIYLNKYLNMFLFILTIAWFRMVTFLTNCEFAILS